MIRPEGRWRPRTALAWVPVDVLLDWDPTSTPPEVLARLARDAGVDCCFVDSSVAWAERAAAELHAAGVSVAWVVPGPFWRMAERHGWPAAVRMTVAGREKFDDEIGRAVHEARDDVHRGRDAGVEALVIADDLAGPSGWLVSPDCAMDLLVRAYLYLQLECGSVRNMVFHSDGDVRVLYPALAKMAFSAVHVALEGPAFDAALAAADAVGLDVWGGVSAAHAPARVDELVTGFAREVPDNLVICDDGAIQSVEELRACLEILGRVRG